MHPQPKLTPVSAVPRLFRSPISTAGRAEELLDGLGRTADEVAASLLARKCYGVRNECGACPVAEFLLRSDLNPVSVNVGSIDPEVALHFPDDDVTYVPFTDAVQAFITRFDNGHYPELVKVEVTA